MCLCTVVLKTGQSMQITFPVGKRYKYYLKKELFKIILGVNIIFIINYRVQLLKFEIT